jgi:hypothetical protein
MSLHRYNQLAKCYQFSENIVFKKWFTGAARASAFRPRLAPASHLHDSESTGH